MGYSFFEGFFESLFFVLFLVCLVFGIIDHKKQLNLDTISSTFILFLIISILVLFSLWWNLDFSITEYSLKRLGQTIE